jgi:4-amino-4-deoxy-L-arabinose transferase-like glycosyltransferase
MRKEYVVLIFIFLLAVFLRFWQLGQNPPSLNWDEVSIGYNAYSILQTGKDEYGKFLPLIFRSLDDYKQPVYPYLTLISEYFFGLTPFAVRFTSALLGSLTILVMYFFVKELIENKKVALLSSFFLCILPWHIQFSRTAIEANVGLFFLILGALALLISLKKQSWLLPISVVLFAISMYSYLSFRIIAPLIGFSFFIAYFKKIVKNKIPLIIATVIVCFTLSVLIVDTFFQKGLTRFNGSSVFDHFPEKYEQAKSEMNYDAKLKINLLRRILHDSPIMTSLDLVERGYLTHFSADFLFFYLDQKHHDAPNVGLLYLWMLPFIPLGTYILFTKNKKVTIILISWILISPLPASVTWDIPHAIRSITMLIPLQILTAIGVVSFFNYIFRKKMFISLFTLFVFTVFVLFGLITFLHQYFVHLPHEKSENWVYGREELTKYLNKQKNNYKKVVISTRLEWPYIFLLFYSAYDPKKYLASGGTISGGWGEEGNHYDKYEFHKFSYGTDKITGSVLYVGLPGEFPSNASPIKIIYYLDGKPAIYLVEKKM